MTSRPRYWFDEGVALSELRRYFRYGKEIVRIASGFFTVKGYGLVQRSLQGKKVKLLVGIREPAAKRARQRLLADIMRDLRQGVDDESYNRYDAVVNLVERIQGGGFDIVDARAKDHHSKLYIVDDRYAIFGSSNVSERGLKKAIESGTWISHRATVADIIQDYERHFNDPACHNITQELLDCLLAWLALATPWDVYLKTLEAMRALADIPVPRPDYRSPIGYQRDVVALALKQIEEHGGSMVVASTGLGKTVIGTEIARHLFVNGAINKVVVIGPAPVKRHWERSIQSAGLGRPSYYTFHACNVEDPGRDGSLLDLLYDLEWLNDRDLLIVDESHVLRNRFVGTDEPPYVKEQLAFTRLVPAIECSGCRVLLLTGTPFSTNVEDINDQLYLLPHTAPSARLPGLGDLFEDDRTFQIVSTSDLRTGPVSLVITTPYVAKYYSTRDPDGDYIDFHGEKRYLPGIYLRQANVPLPVEDEMQAALEGGYFQNYNPHPQYTSIIATRARVAWHSSPWALREVIQKTIDTPDIPYLENVSPGERRALLRARFPDNRGYWLSFEMDQLARHAVLSPILGQLGAMSFENDAKFRTLCAILGRMYEERRQVIVFTEALITAAYLERGLRKQCHFLRVGSTVYSKRGKSRRYQRKGTEDAERVMCDFARVAYERPPLPYDELTYHVLITTDAYGVGVNLQDASAVINYDMAWTPINPAQRAGRILRLWHEPRAVYLYSFKPTYGACRASSELARHANATRWDVLVDRHNESLAVVDLPTVATESRDLEDLKDLAPAEIEDLGQVDFTQDPDQDTSPIFEHLAHLEKDGNAEYLAALSDDLRSAMVYPGKHRLIFVLLKVGDQSHWPVYDLSARRLLTKRNVEVLDLIACSQDTQLAAHKPHLIEEYATTCIKAWCEEHGVSPGAVERICTLYLKPQAHRDEAEGLLR